ncbi:MAG TPA: hypothetical protein VMV93_13335 [Chloroflexota bacterium]|nr:hypothetical protein [Chloroflexota bacterium]
MPLTARGAQHVLVVRARAMANRAKSIVLVSQLSTPTGMADPAAPALADGGAGGTFPGGSLYAVCVAKNASGQTRAGSEAGPVAMATNHLVQITPPVVAGATAFDLYLGTAAGAEVLVGSTAAGLPFTLSAPLPAGSAPPSNSYTTVLGIFRHERGINPADLDETGAVGDRRLMEVILELPIDTPLEGVTMVADTPTPTPEAVAAAEKFSFIDLVTAGIVPGGDRWLGIMRRLR